MVAPPTTGYRPPCFGPRNQISPCRIGDEWNVGVGRLDLGLGSPCRGGNDRGLSRLSWPGVYHVTTTTMVAASHNEGRYSIWRS